MRKQKICACGRCQRCRWRKATKRYYDRHLRANPEAQTEYYARRAEWEQRKTPNDSVSDEELDRRALAKWRPEWGDARA